MTPEEFVRNFYIERKSLIGQYLSSDSQTDAAALIAELGLDEQKRGKTSRSFE
jgi:hypothetical protein